MWLSFEYFSKSCFLSSLSFVRFCYYVYIFSSLIAQSYGCLVNFILKEFYYHLSSYCVIVRTLFNLFTVTVLYFTHGWGNNFLYFLFNSYLFLNNVIVIVLWCVSFYLNISSLSTYFFNNGCWFSKIVARLTGCEGVLIIYEGWGGDFAKQHIFILSLSHQNETVLNPLNVKCVVT